MIAYNLKTIVELVPSALEHVKQASVTEDYPIGTPADAIASALSIEYAKHTGQSVDFSVLEKVARAVDLHGVSDQVDTLAQDLYSAYMSHEFAKYSNPVEDFQVKCANFLGDLGGFKDVSGLEKSAQDLSDFASDVGCEVPEYIRRYTAQGWLNKQAAIDSLGARFQASKDVGYVKLASAIGRLDEAKVSQETLRDICRTVTEMDKKAHLDVRGFDFYQEALFTKEADFASALPVRIAGFDVPYEKIHRLGRDRIAQYIGEDVAREMDHGPANAKQVFETLPLDLQRVLLDLTKNV